MIQLIRDHNEFNGIRFSVIDFLLMAVPVVGFAVPVAGAALRATFSAAARARHLAEHPQAQRATWTLAIILTLIPGAVLVLALAGWLRARR